MTSTSTGRTLSAASWLDTHYLAGQPEYESMLRSAGFRKGWRVLDAGCGGGSFLPLLSVLLGPTGRLDTIDLAPENVAQVEALIASGRLGCPADVRVGDITALPYDDSGFDAIWSTNVTQYLPDAIPETMLGEACAQAGRSAGHQRHRGQRVVPAPHSTAAPLAALRLLAGSRCAGERFQKLR
jgi:arsenite methyltransferase